MLTPAESVIKRVYIEERESQDYFYGSSLTYAQRPAGLQGHEIRVDMWSARKAGERTGVSQNRVLQILWKDDEYPKYPTKTEQARLRKAERKECSTH